MFTTCLEKQQRVKLLFANCHTQESVYQKIILLGKELPPILEEEKTEESLVPGCQSRMHLLSSFSEKKIFYRAFSDALISAGLAQMMLTVYSGERPETVLKCPPSFLEDIKVTQSLSPSRSNGLSSLYLKMKQEAIKYISLK